VGTVLQTFRPIGSIKTPAPSCAVGGESEYTHRELKNLLLSRRQTDSG